MSNHSRTPLCDECWQHQAKQLQGDGLTVGYCKRCEIALRIMHKDGKPVHVLSVWPCSEAEFDRMSSEAERTRQTLMAGGRAN